MSKRSEQLLDDSFEFNDRTEFAVEDDDFGFLIDSEGNLKTVFGPEILFDTPPENVLKILEMFGVDTSELMIRSGVTVH